jgi:hypothetical protein
MSHWHDTMVDRPETDGAVYVTGWTESCGCAGTCSPASVVLGLAAWHFLASLGVDQSTRSHRVPE